MRPLVLALACVLGSCGGAATGGGATVSGSGESACEGTLTPRFAWPDRLQADVTGTARMFDQGQEWPEGFAHGLVMRMGAEGTSHRLHFDTREPGSSVAHGLLPRIDGRYLEVVVGADGNVTRVEGASDLRLALAALARLQHTDPEQVRLVAEALGDEWVLAHQRAYWSHLVGTWSGRTLTCGTPVTVHAPSMEMDFGHVDADVTETLEWLGWRPCSHGETEQRAGRCALLRVTESSTLPLVQLDPARPPGRLDARRVTEVIAEPDTLVPHALRFVEETRLGGEPTPSAVLRNELHFAYVEPTPAARQTILAIQRDGWTFYWPSDAHVGGPMELDDTAECRQLFDCCQALSQRSGAEGMICATSVATHVSGDCDTPLRLTAFMVLGEQRELPQACVPPVSSQRPPPPHT